MDIFEFRESYEKLKERLIKLPNSEALMQLETYLSVYRMELPPFYLKNFADRDYEKNFISYRGISYKEPAGIRTCYNSKEILIDPRECIGEAWLFSDDRSEGRPVPGRLARCLYLPAENAPAIYPSKLGSFYYCGDGCHRIYAAYLLGRKVKAIVYDTWVQCE